MKLTSSPILAFILGLAAALLAAGAAADPVRIQLAQSAPADSTTSDPRLADLQYWNAIKDSKKAADYQAYLDKFPNGDFADLAKIRVKQYGGDAAVTPPSVGAPTETTPSNSNAPDPRLVELDFWNQVKDSKNPEDYQAYLNKYPNGEFVDLAKLRIQQLGKAAPPAAPAAAPAPAPQAAPAVAPAPLPPIDAMEATLYAASSARIRATPEKSGAVLTRVGANTPLHVSGRTADGSWYRVALADGGTGFIAASVTSPQPVAVQPPKPATQAAAAKPSGSDADLCKLGSAASPADRVAACERIANAPGLDDAAKRAALLDLAAALDVAKRWDDSIRKYEQAAALSPNDAATYSKIGAVRLEQRRFREARAAFDKAAMLDNKNPDYVFERGIAAAGLGDFAKARDEAKRALLSKEDPRYYERVGEYELALGNLDAAKTAIERGRKADPAFSSLVTAAVDYFNGAYDSVAGAAGAALGATADPTAALWKALALKAKGDAAGAAAALESGRTAAGDGWPAPVFDYLLGKIPESKLLELVKARDPKDQAEHLCVARFFAGEWAFRSGDNAAARTDLENAANAQAFHRLEHAAAKARLANMIK